MKFDIVLAGVGGQGVLSLAAIIGASAVDEGLTAKQSEAHGMSQRGGSVVAHLRLADHPIASDLIARGTAEMILSMEPVEGLRQLPYLAEDGVFVTNSNSVENIPGYPPRHELIEHIHELPRAVLVDGEKIARSAGLKLAINVALVGAASRFLPLSTTTLEACIEELFGKKGERVLAANLDAFRNGRAEPAEP